MIDVKSFSELGRAEHGWLSARHHFSFAGYKDPERMGLGPLRVWNDDNISPRTGFPMHPHRDMEILTYVRQGAITHEDSLGNRGRTEAGDVQVMSAGTGIVHSEYNLEDEDTRIFQIWIQPNENHLTPRWEATGFPHMQVGKKEELRVLASGRPEDVESNVLMIHQDASLLGARLNAGQSVDHVFAGNRGAYLVPSGGDLLINGRDVPDRAGVMIIGEHGVGIEARTGPVDVPHPWDS